MKRCSTCQKTYEDSMRFCQIDGTPLVDDAANVAVAADDNAFKTTVVGQDEMSSASADLNKPPVGSSPFSNRPDDADSNKTMIASGSPNISGGGGGEINFDDLTGDVKKDEPSAASSPFDNFGAPDKTNFGDSAAPGDTVISSFSTPTPPPTAPQSNSNPFSNESLNQTPFGSAPPLSSPFDTPPSSPTSYQPPTFQEPEQRNEPNFGAPQMPFNQSPFEQAQSPFGQPIQPSQWTPPPAPEANWQNQNIGANTPFQPPAVAAGQDQTLPIVSLICGIISVPCCWLGFLLGPAALIAGFFGRKNANGDSQKYGGGGMALAGMITGGVGLLISVGYYLLLISGLFAR